MVRLSFFVSFLKIFIIASLLSSYMFFIDVNNAKAEDVAEGQWMGDYCKGVDIGIHLERILFLILQMLFVFQFTVDW